MMPPSLPLGCNGGPGNQVTTAVPRPRAADGRQWQPDRQPEFDMMRAWAVAGLVVFHSAVVFAAGASWFVKDPRPSAGFAKDASTQLLSRLRFA
jgi:hypothetical protein